MVVEKLPWETVVEIQNQKYAHAKHVYYITSSSMAKLRGCQTDMCSYMPKNAGRIKVMEYMYLACEMMGQALVTRLGRRPSLNISWTSDSMQLVGKKHI